MSQTPVLVGDRRFRVTNGLASLKAPLGKEEHPAAYGLGRIFQAAPREAGILLNLRAGGVDAIDFELGVDLVLFGDPRTIDLARAHPIARNEAVRHPRSGEPLALVKYPCNIGFVPLGAARPGGAPHPHAGTGFSVGKCIGFPADLSVRRWHEAPDPHVRLALIQYAYDGQRFQATDRQMLGSDELLDGWDLPNNGMTAALPDGDDLLMMMEGAPLGKGTQASKGPCVVRWRRTGGAWRAVSASPLADAAGLPEPSMVRDQDGSLLATARSGWPPRENTARVQAWRSEDGEGWTRRMDIGRLRSPGPVAVSRTAGGRPFIMGNTFSTENPTSRATLSAWPITGDRTGVAENLVAFDPEAFVGPPRDYAWFADHPIGAVVRLADGRLRSLVAFRLCDNTEVVKGALPTSATGCCIEEVFADGENEAPLWRFGED